MDRSHPLVILLRISICLDLKVALYDLFIYRLFVLKMSWSEILLSNLDMQMQRYTNVKMNGALVPCATSRLIFN